jgi:transposase
VAIAVTVRRFRCGNLRCSRWVFVEQLPKVSAPRSRRTCRLAEIQRHIGMALGGAAGGRLAERLALPASRDTLLRLVRRRVPTVPTSPPVIIVIDDFAWKRGQRYGTVVYDLERRRIIDLLPDRQQATVEASLTRHPGITLVARDRGAGYGPAVARACPRATQVADRWHLMENASAAFLQAVRQNFRAIRETLATSTIDPDLHTCAQRLRYEGFLRCEADNAVIRPAASAGMSIKAIVRRTGRSRKVVRDVVRGSRTDVFGVRTNSLEPYLMRLDADWVAGCHNGAELFRRAQVDRIWGQSARRCGVDNTAPSCRSCRDADAYRATIRPLDYTPHDRGTRPISHADALLITVIEKAAPQLVAARDLFDRFQKMIRSKASAVLDGWIEDAATSPLSTFAKGIVADRQAIAAAITEPWSNGQIEGQIQNSR